MTNMETAKVVWYTISLCMVYPIALSPTKPCFIPKTHNATQCLPFYLCRLEYFIVQMSISVQSITA